MAASEHISELEAEIRRHKEFLEPFEAGRAFVRGRQPNGEWRDDTQNIIAEEKRTIAFLEKLVAALKAGDLR